MIKATTEIVVAIFKKITVFERRVPVIFIFQINGSINCLDEILDLAGDCSCKLTLQKMLLKKFTCNSQH